MQEQLDITHRLNRLEDAARRLHATPDQVKDLDRRALELVHEYYATLDQVPVLEGVEDGARSYCGGDIGEHAAPESAVFEAMARILGRSGLKLGSGRLFAFIPGSGMHASAVADLMAAATNRYVGASFAAPQAVELERSVIRWLACELGYPETAAGDLTSGGSVANLTAIAVARESQGVAPADYAHAPIYCTRHAHHCIDKALRILGLDHCPVRRVPVDEHYRMDVVALASEIHRDLECGLRPWLVIATAGTTDTGAVDPLESIADVAREHGLWLHVDGAYGAAFRLCAPGRRILTGMERSDSVVLDPHKGLFTPFGSGVVLVREGHRLQAAMTERAPYMEDAHALAPGAGAEPYELSVELSRPSRGLRLWLPLKLYGAAAYRAALEEKLLLARYCHQRLAAMANVEVGPQPDLSVVTFRGFPWHPEQDAMNRRLVDTIQREGRVALSSTVFDGRVTLRMAILSLATHRAHVDEALAVLAETIGRLAGS